VNTGAPTGAGSTPAVTSSIVWAPLLRPGALASPSAPPIQIPSLNYDPGHAVLPDPKLTPGDTLPAVTAANLCTPGWASEHRHVSESMRNQVYTEYSWPRGPDCCGVDHLIPLELGGSNDMRNLWPEPYGPTPRRKTPLKTSSMSVCAAAKCHRQERKSASRQTGFNVDLASNSREVQSSRLCYRAKFGTQIFVSLT
jgi:hypothetical protein